MQIQITQSDLMVGKLAAKGWYLCKCTNFEQKTSDAGDSTNFIPHLQVKEGPMLGKLFKKYFNSKAPGNFVDLLAATGEVVNGPTAFDSDVVAQKMIGSDFWVEVGVEPYNGRLTNQVMAILSGDKAPQF